MSENKGRKIPHTFENPIDNQLLKLCDKLVLYCQKLDITPNSITIFRIIMSIYIFYYMFYTCNKFIPIVGTILFYFLDCMDGHLARSTNQVTVLGDYLDHYADIIFNILIFIFMFIKNYPYKYFIIICFCLLVYMCLIHLGLQQKNYNNIKNVNKPTNNITQILDNIENIEEELLDKLNCLHIFEPENISWTKYFGCGTLYIVMILIIFWINYNCK